MITSFWVKFDWERWQKKLVGLFLTLTVHSQAPHKYIDWYQDGAYRKYYPRSKHFVTIAFGGPDKTERST